MMGGIPRPILASLVFALGAFILWRRARGGWQLPDTEVGDVAERD
jgi:hypothetical protein